MDLALSSMLPSRLDQVSTPERAETSCYTEPTFETLVDVGRLTVIAESGGDERDQNIHWTVDATSIANALQEHEATGCNS